MQIPIKNAEIWKAGNSAVITIPADYIKNGQLTVGKHYRITIEEESEEADVKSL